MKRYLTALACILPIPLGSCTPQQQNSAAQCGLALYAANATTAADLLMAAQQVPACRALAIDAMQQVVADIMARRGIK